MEKKLESFERLAEKRVTEALKKLRLVGNLANKRNYRYTGEHARQIMDALETELKRLKALFKDEARQDAGSFSFKKQ